MHDQHLGGHLSLKLAIKVYPKLYPNFELNPAMTLILSAIMNIDPMLTLGLSPSLRIIGWSINPIVEARN